MSCFVCRLNVSAHSTVLTVDVDLGIHAFIQEGTVIVSPNRDHVDMVNLEWSNPCAYVCLPDGFYVSDSGCSNTTVPLDDTVNETLGLIRACVTRTCSGSYPNIELSSAGVSFPVYNPTTPAPGTTSANYVNVSGPTQRNLYSAVASAVALCTLVDHLGVCSLLPILRGPMRVELSQIAQQFVLGTSKFQGIYLQLAKQKALRNIQNLVSTCSGK